MRPGLREARKAHGLTQAELVERMRRRRPNLKIDRPQISKYERGLADIPGRVLTVLCEVLETPMEILLAQTNGQHPLEPPRGP
jgi:transcriptional regulator with XRE-family HTH domain